LVPDRPFAPGRRQQLGNSGAADALTASDVGPA
jgi:hypothetical protein